MDLAVLKSKLIHSLDIFVEYPWLALILAVILIIWFLYRVKEKQTSAGSFTIIIIAVVLFMWAMGQMTGLGFGMSF